MLKLQQYFCRHDFGHLAQHRSTQSNLWRCSKCKVYYIQHYGIGIGYKCVVPNIGGWISNVKGLKEKCGK